MRSLALLVLLFALVGFAAGFSADASDSELVDFSSEVGPTGEEWTTPTFLESDSESEAEVEAEADVEAEAEADVELSLPAAGQPCGRGGTCSAKAAWCGQKTVVHNLCAGAAVCCQPATTTPAAAPVTQPAATPVPATSGATAFGTTAVTRAGTWVTAKLHYCQAPRGGKDVSGSCPSICSRQANPLWDAYRSDCSGLVSYAWGLPAPGVSTAGMSTVARAIACTSLRAGDAINRAGHHTMLFVNWVTPGKQAVFYEEPGCDLSEPWARAVTIDLTCAGTAVNTARRGDFIAVRKNGQ